MRSHRPRLVLLLGGVVVAGAGATGVVQATSPWVVIVSLLVAWLGLACVTAVLVTEGTRLP